MTRIEGFWIYWGGEHHVWAEREAAPKHKYRFEVSADWKRIGKLWVTPVDVADGDPAKDAERLAKKAKEAVEEFLREELGHAWGHVSLYQLHANACIAGWRVASYPCVGVRSS
jgi:hypothetical protein